MATLGIFFFLFIFFFFSAYTATSVKVCSSSSCRSTGPAIRFPFRVRDLQTDRCGYPGFDISCNSRSQTIVSLPNSGEFTVRNIDYAAQAIRINDPENCLPKRILHLNLSGSPFHGANLKNYTFINCSSVVSEMIISRFMPISCLGGDNYTVWATPYESFVKYVPFTASCRKISTVLFPVHEYGFLSELSEDLQLTWGVPSCRSCEARGGTCGFKSDTGSEIGCFNVPNTGLPRSAKYGIIIGVGIPGFVCIIGLACYVCSRVRACAQQRRPNTQLSTSIAPQSAVIVMGLDGPTIESYPKTVLGESRRLPKPNDGTCPICLSEYQPKETLRTIPECNHYFHAHCVDEWLTMNATCPLCRNSPAESSVVTPCPSSSSSSLSSSSTLSS